MKLFEKLVEIQSELNAPKNRRNNFGNYNYRSAEDILEALKPLLKKQACYLQVSDELQNIGDRYYVKATATICDGTESISSTGFAREEENKKGMDGSQITGASSSYARKYALNGLFLIDDGQDSDSTNTNDKETKTEKPKQTTPERKPLTSNKNWYNDTDKHLEEWRVMIAEGKTTPQAIVDHIESEGFSLSTANKNTILNLF